MGKAPARPAHQPPTCDQDFSTENSSHFQVFGLGTHVQKDAPEASFIGNHGKCLCLSAGERSPDPSVALYVFQPLLQLWRVGAGGRGGEVFTKRHFVLFC